MQKTAIPILSKTTECIAGTHDGPQKANGKKQITKSKMKGVLIKLSLRAPQGRGNLSPNVGDDAHIVPKSLPLEGKVAEQSEVG